MRTYLIRILIFASMSCILAASSQAAIKITSVPFTISKRGTYVLAGNLTLSGINQIAITVTASDVVVDLGGFTLAATASSGTNVGIEVSAGAQNVTIQNGSISIVSGICVHLLGSDETVQNLRLESSGAGVFAESTSNYCMIQNCFIMGGGSDCGVGINGGGGTVVKNNQIINEFDGCCSGGGNIFIANYIASCNTGLGLAGTDKYQGNVTVACATAFSGGIAVGTENN
jgi:hypothetical protein